MSQNSLRSNLSAARFPFLSTKMGRSIILAQYDENYDRTVQFSSEDVSGKGIPQVYYMHNVVPTVEGFQSVAFKQLVPGVVNVTDFNQAIPVRDSNDNTMLFSPGLGENYVYTAVLNAWQSTDAFAPGAVKNTTNISYVYLQGAHYICIAGQGVYQYDPVTNHMVAVTFIGVTMAAIFGITTSSGYMIAYDLTTSYWSSVANPLDFTPSLVTGAGSGTPLDAKGNIVTAKQISGGFVMYTTANAVSAQYTGNVRFPFIFKEVVGSGGVQDSNQVSYLSNYATHYAITSSGVQQITRDQAVPVFDDVSDFISTLVYEDFDSSTRVFTETKLSTPVATKLVLISDRYLCFSYGLGVNNYSYALVHDLALKRWGKLKFPHVAAFEYNWPNLFGTTTFTGLTGRSFAALWGTSFTELSTKGVTAPAPRSSFAFMQANGAVWQVDMEDMIAAPDSVFIIGKYQQSRNRLFTLHSVNVDNLYTANPWKVFSLYSLDGKNNLPPVDGSLLGDNNNTVDCGFRLTGINASIGIIGTFNLNTITINFTKHGQR